MKTEIRRRRRSAAQWQGLVDAFEQSDLSQTEFAERESISAKTLYSWQRRLRVNVSRHTTSKQAFVEVKASPDDSVAQDISVSLELGDGKIIRFSQTPSVSYLLQIIGAL